MPVYRVRSVLSIPATLLGLTLQAQAVPPERVLSSNITLAEVKAAQTAWCQGLLKISAAYATGGLSQARATAEVVIDQSYAYRYGPVAFKPTLAAGSQTFRPTKAGALAYFLGGDPAFPKDKGFAIKPWRSCEVVNQVIQLHGSYANTMGNVVFTNTSGESTTVDKTWGFLREPDGTIRIVLHHSSLPFGS